MSKDVEAILCLSAMVLVSYWIGGMRGVFVCLGAFAIFVLTSRYGT